MSRLMSDPSRHYPGAGHVQPGRPADVLVWVRRINPGTKALERQQLTAPAADALMNTGAGWRLETPYDGNTVGPYEA